MDYQLGEDIKEKLIPRAIDWFTGEALAFEEIDDLDEGDYDDEDEDEDEDDLSDDRDEDEEESEEDVSVTAVPHVAPVMLNEVQDDGAKPGKEAAECKQS